MRRLETAAITLLMQRIVKRFQSISGRSGFERAQSVQKNLNQINPSRGLKGQEARLSYLL